MELPINNHIEIHNNGITVDGVPLLVEKDSLVISDYGNPGRPTTVMLTLIPNKITIRQCEDAAAEDTHRAAGVIHIDVEPRLRLADDTRYSLAEVVEKLNALGFTVVQ